MHPGFGASQLVIEVKHLPANAGDMGWEDPLEGLATHSSILAWRVPWTEEAGGLQSIGSPRVEHNRSNLACLHAAWFLSFFFFFAKLHSMWGLSSLTRDGTFAPCIGSPES